MQAEPVEGPVRERVVPERGEAAEAAAAVGPREAAGRHRQAVGEGQGGVVPGRGREVPPERELDGPEVGRLAQEGGAVDLPQAREQVAEVTPEVGVQAPVGVEAEELADDLDRQHLAVRERRRRAALTQPAPAAEVADEVVHEAEHGDDEGLQVHGRSPLRLIRREERLGAPKAPAAIAPLENPHIGLASEGFRATSTARSYPQI